MKLNEPGGQKLGRYRSPVSRHSIQRYILIYYRLRKREPLIALSSHQRRGGGGGGALISASAVPHRRVRTDLNTLTCLVSYYINSRYYNVLSQSWTSFWYTYIDKQNQNE